MKKKIAVLVRERQAEALRMAVGLSLEDDEVNVFIMDRKLEDTPGITLNIETLNELRIRICTNSTENKFEFMSTRDIARALVNYDSVLPY